MKLIVWATCLVIIAVVLPSKCTSYESRADERGEIKEKCKEHVEEALRKYWSDGIVHSISKLNDTQSHGRRSDCRLLIKPNCLCLDILKLLSLDVGDDEEENQEFSNKINSLKKEIEEEDDDDIDGCDDEDKELKKVENKEEENEEVDEENDGGKDEDEERGENQNEVDEDKDDEDKNDEDEEDKDDDEDEEKEHKYSNLRISRDKIQKFLTKKKEEKKKVKDQDKVSEEHFEEETSDSDVKEKDLENETDEDEEEDGKEENEDKVEEVKDKDDKEEDEAESKESNGRSRSHIDDILRTYEIGSLEYKEEENLILSIFRELKKIYETTIKPLETLYKYKHVTTRLISDAEIFAKPMVIFLGGPGTGKTSLVNYLLKLDSTSWQLKTGLSTVSPHFNILSYGENFSRISPTELAADFTFSSLQQFGQGFLEQYIQANRVPINILQKMTIIDSPGLVDLINKGTIAQPKGIDNEVYQWFIDRSDIIYVVIDVNQLHLSQQLQSMIEQLKGREVRFIINKSDIVSHSQIINILGQLLWILSPIMPAERPPQVYALTTIPKPIYDAFLDDQEQLWLNDLSEQISGLSRVESRIAALRRHAVRVRNHVKLIDCYLATFYKHKGIFTFGSSSRTLASDITENPHHYRIYSGAVAGQLHNISRYDLPDPGIYKEFFRSNSLIDFKPLSSTCSYFRGCPIDKLDLAIAYELPELVGKYKKLTKIPLG